ncbi:MAG: Lrp/AsnC family transcriptional regulator [Putridiphycobacter sp.]
MGNFTKQKLDAIDSKLIELLQKDSRQSIKQLGQELNLSSTPIYERIKKLEKNGIIESYSAKVNPKKLGKELLVFTNVSLKEHSKDFLLNFENKVQTLDEVIECHHVSGEHDYLIKVLVVNMADYRDFLTNKLAKIANIGNVHSSFVVGEIKQNAIIKP